MVVEDEIDVIRSRLAVPSLEVSVSAGRTLVKGTDVSVLDISIPVE